MTPCFEPVLGRSSALFLLPMQQATGSMGRSKENGFLSNGLAWLGQAFKHEEDHSEPDEGGDRVGIVFEISDQPTVPVDPQKRSGQRA